MASDYKKMGDIDLLKLYRESNDLTAYKVLFEKYVGYSRIYASEIVESFRSEHLLDFSELHLVGVFSFQLAVKNFDYEGLSFKAFWRTIAFNEMMNVVYNEFKQQKYVVRTQLLEEKSGTIVRPVYVKGFSDGVESDDELLKSDIEKFLFDPKNEISEMDANMFLAYLEDPNYSNIAKEFKISRKTVTRRINIVRERVIAEVLGEDI